MQVGLKFLVPGVSQLLSCPSRCCNLNVRPSFATRCNHDFNLELFIYITQGANSLIRAHLFSYADWNCVSGNGSFRPQEAGQCPYWKLGFYHRRMLQANWAAIEIAFEAMFLSFFWLYSTAQMHKPIFQCFLLFFFHFWNSSNKNWLLLLLHHPLPWHYSILHPQFILGGENNSPVLTHVIGNQ